MKAIIEKWPNRQALADDIGEGVAAETVTGWCRPSRRVPARYLLAMLAGSEARDLGVTALDLVKASAEVAENEC